MPAYITLKRRPLKKGEVKSSHPFGKSNQVVLDYDKNQELVGIEILNSHYVLEVNEIYVKKNGRLHIKGMKYVKNNEV
jgi:uncharacterized protein YuzE